MKVINELGFEQPSDIQAQAIPQLLSENRDFIGLAQTGTGKTAAFGLPLLERIDPNNPCTQALILAPTRELGQQIAQQIGVFSRYVDGVNFLAVYGGAAISNQIRALRKPQHIIIATPGRLLDLIQRKAVNLEQLQYLVLDEADEMLNMGFKKDLDRILSYAPKDKSVWLFSATMSADIRRIVNKYMQDPAEVRLNGKNEANLDIDHQFAMVRQSNKMEALTRFMDAAPDLRGVVFCRTKRDTQNLANKLHRKKYRADALHGDMSQSQRDRVMRKFRANDLQLLVATDVAARGIDVNDLTHVFHFALPDDIDYYTHRSGRTGRAGKKGISMVFINGQEKGRIKLLEKKLGLFFDQVEIPAAADIHSSKVEDWCRNILDKKTNGKLDPRLIEKANTLFGNLSKEELTAKLLMAELEKYDMGASEDLNEPSQSLSKEHQGHGKKGERPPHKKGRKPRGKKFAKANRW